MRIPGEPPAFGPLMVTAAACPPFECPQLQSTDDMPGADGMSTPPAPEDGAEFDDLLSDALLALNCCGGGGGGDPPPSGCYGCCCCCVLATTDKLADVDGQVVAAGGCCASLACDDGYACTTNDQCGGNPGFPCYIPGCGQCCGIPKNCDDGNPCTGDVCYSFTGTCMNVYLCNDGNECTTDGCDGNGCTHVARDCDDDDPCTYDYCHFSTGCGHTPVAPQILIPFGNPTSYGSANSSNEIAYNSSATPSLAVVCTADLVSDPSLLRWTIQDAGPVRAVWEPHVPGDPYTGLGLSPTALYVGLPPANDHFGGKLITLTFDALPNCADTQLIEIFFPPLARNNLGPPPDNIPTTIDLNQVEVKRKE